MFKSTITGAAQAEEGIRKSSEHAERVLPGWKNQALDVVRRFASGNPRFQCEEVRAFGESSGLPQPLDGRAWGAVMRAAAKAGIVISDGYARTQLDPKIHDVKVVWKSKIFN